jgi:hypothetical protein
MKHEHADPFAPASLQHLQRYYESVCRHCLTATYGVGFPFDGFTEQQ